MGTTPGASLVLKIKQIVKFNCKIAYKYRQLDQGLNYCPIGNVNRPRPK